MDNMMKVSATVVSYAENSGRNRDNFYLNGRYRHQYEMENIQVSAENSRPEYLFAISGGLDKEETEQRSAISIVKEISKLHEGFRNHEGDIDSKIEQIKEHVQEINNVIYTISLNNIEDAGKNTSFASVMFSGGKAAILNMGKSKAFINRNGSLVNLLTDGKKTEKLLKMGILTDEQAKMISGNYGLEQNMQFQKSKNIEVQVGDLFVLCSEGLAEYVDEEKIHEIILSKRSTGYIANALIKEALRLGIKKSMTVLVARIDESGTVQKSKPIFSRNFSKKLDHQNKKKKENLSTLIAILITSAAIIVVLIAAYLLFFTKSDKKNSINTLVPVTSQGATITDGTIPDVNDSSGQAVNTQPGQNSDHPKTYTVKSGDTLQGISEKIYGDINKYKDIMAANKITNPNSISINQVLILP